MQVDFNQNLKNLDGQEIKEAKEVGPPCECCGRATGQEVPIQVKSVCVNALLARHQNEQVSGDEYFRRYKLANLIHSAESPVNIKVEDIVLIKAVVAKAYGPLIIGQVWTLLEG